MNDLAQKYCKDAIKTSRRDIAYVVSQGTNFPLTFSNKISGKTGATTVSGTSVIAEKVGIKVFVTGGIGGVHRHGETSEKSLRM